jgi:hypothetical protein
MSYQYHGTRDLIAMPGRSVQTYPSGLVRVERSFMCRKADVARYRNTLRMNEPMPFDDGAPAIDGLFIFPEPQEQVRDDGFVEFRVTAYGRTNLTGLTENSFIRGSFYYSSEELDGSFIAANALATMPRFTQKIVLLNSEIPDFSFQINVDLLPGSVGMFAVDIQAVQTESTIQYVPYEIWENYIMSGPSGALLYNGFRLFSGPAFAGIPHTSRQRSSYTSSQEITSVNFGIFNEYTITYRFFYSVSFRRS